jgi:hypothetical protein
VWWAFQPWGAILGQNTEENRLGKLRSGIIDPDTNFSLVPTFKYTEIQMFSFKFL